MKLPAAPAVPMLLLLAAAAPQAASQAADPPATIPHPHPVIAEVLYNVPKDEAGDANKDGTRDSTGDEFIEITNPHETAIDLKGYTIVSRLAWADELASREPAEDGKKKTGKRGVRFTFPALELPPGAVVVVFNGHNAEIPGPCGSAKAAPSAVNEQFASAAVFSMEIGARNSALNNSGDFVLLLSPSGDPIDCVTWGDPDPAPPDDALRVADVGVKGEGSYQRPAGGANAEPKRHTALDDRLFSPGELPKEKIER